MKRFLFLLGILASLLLSSSAFAVTPDEVLDDPAQEARARDISAELRCMVCQNQSIDDSNAELAKDLRLLVRERIVAGDSNEEVLDYLVARYGEFVLLNPRFSVRTALLWSAPVLLLLVGFLIVWSSRRASSRVATQPRHLSPDEEKRLAELLSPEAGEVADRTA